VQKARCALAIRIEYNILVAVASLHKGYTDVGSVVPHHDQLQKFKVYGFCSSRGESIMKIKLVLLVVCLLPTAVWAQESAAGAAAGNLDHLAANPDGPNEKRSTGSPKDGKEPWRGVHIGIGSEKAVEQLTSVVGELAKLGVNVIVAEINYGYEYRSHPEVRRGNASNARQIKISMPWAPVMEKEHIAAAVKVSSVR
jgi:hypothetical protein